jgi:hypothetical protein
MLASPVTSAGSFVQDYLDAFEWKQDDGRLQPMLRSDPKQEVGFAAQGESQVLFLSCPVTEVLFCGNRGGGKTVVELMDFGQHCGVGYGVAWRGVLLGKEFTRLRNCIDLSLEWFPRVFPNAVYNRSEHHWTWPDGEKLFFAQMERPEDYHKYHGWGLSWIGWDELTNWAAPDCYQKMFSTLRSTRMDMPRKVRATCNPGGAGHNWVKHRFGLPIPPGKPASRIITDDQSGVMRVAIRSDLAENRALMIADPEYISRLKASASSPHELKAWLEGSWDIVAGGMFDDLWEPAIHVVPPVPFDKIPASWRLDRSFDWGQEAPFSVGWWAQSSGEPLTWEGVKLGTVRGDLIRLGEWYGWTGQPNKGLRLVARDIAKGIVEREEKWGVRGRVRSGPADSMIWNADPRDPGQSIAGDMAKAPFGVSWEQANKRPGSRKQGWAQIRQMLKFAKPGPSGAREYPGLFISSACDQFLRCFPVTQRDSKDPDDVDTETEDHIADEVRYRCLRPRAVEKPVAHLVY